MKPKENLTNEKVKPKENLTNEKLKAQFSNQFDLVICAINFARDIIKERSGAGQNDNQQNSAVQALIRLSERNLP